MSTDDHVVQKRRIEDQERRLQFISFSLQDALAIGGDLLAHAPAPLAIGVRIGDRMLFAALADGANSEQQALVVLKLNTVQRFGHSSLWWFHHLRTQGRTSPLDVPWIDARSYTHFGGGFPLSLGGQVVGGVAVSGLPHEEDHELIVRALGHHLRRETSGTTP
jgi:uncharacterized protein (UPF0303 family)